MIDLRRSLLALSLAALSGCAGHVEGASETGDTADLVNGRLDSGHLNVTEFLFLRGTQGFVCTTTLIGSQTAITAAHCWNSETTNAQIVGPDGARILVVKGEASPAFQGGNQAAQAAHDICVLHLAHPVYNLEPSMLSTTPPTFGEKITMVGYGVNDEQGTRDELRRSGSSWVWNVFDGYFEEDLTSSAISTLGHGDSGGPAFVLRNGREEIAGIASRVTGFTKGIFGIDFVQAYHARVDYDYSWIRGVVGSDLYDGTRYAKAPIGTPTATLTGVSATKDGHSVANQPFKIYASEAGTGAVDVTLRVNGAVVYTGHTDALPGSQAITTTLPAGTQFFDLEVADSATGVIMQQKTWNLSVTAS